MLSCVKGEAVVYTCPRCNKEFESYDVWFTHTMYNKNCGLKEVDLD